MILVDTNIIIQFWRNRDKNMEQVFLSENVAICGVVKAELLHGARNSNDVKKIIDALDVFPYVDMKKEDWDLLGKNLFLLRSHGITLPFQDAIIATLALSNKASIWTKDAHFAMIRNVIPDLEVVNF